MLTKRYQLLLLATAILAVYYPSIFSELNSLDDVDMVTNLLNLDHWSLKDVFVPGGNGGLYYRPLLYLSFLIDKELWFMQGSFLHLENILLHLGNSILVYVIAGQLTSYLGKKSSYLPLVAAFCFGLHPLCTEPVNWFSGRTDVLAGIFVLSSAAFVLKFKLEHKKLYLFVSVLLLVFGMMVKEVALAFVAGMFLILVARSTADNLGETSAEIGARQATRRIVFLIICGAGLVLFYVMLRKFAFTSHAARIGMTYKFIINDSDHTLFVFFKDFGFYMKKMFWPFPLNFAIVEVDPLYELLAIPIVLLCCLIAIRRTLISAVVIAGVVMITPAFPVSFNQIAWTPYAERYIYIALAFIMIASVLFFGEFLNKYRNSSAIKAGVACLVIFMGGATLLRNFTWRSNLALYGDTVKKSAGFSKAWNEYGVAYYNKKDLHNAELSFAKASSLYSLYYDEKSDLNLALVLVEEHKEAEAEQVYQRMLNRSHCKSANILQRYLAYLGRKSSGVRDIEYRLKIKNEELKYSHVLYELTGDPLVLVRMGEISRSIGDRRKELDYYQEAYDKFPSGNKYKENLKKRLLKLESM